MPFDLLNQLEAQQENYQRQSASLENENQTVIGLDVDDVAKAETLVKLRHSLATVQNAIAKYVAPSGH